MRTARPLRAAALAAALVGVLAACGSPAVPAAAPVAAAALADTLSFTGRTLDGTPYDAAALKGKPAVLWFWAPWCATCASEAWTIDDAVTTYGDRLGVLGIAGMGGNDAMRDFVKDMEIEEVTSLDDEDGAIWRKFRITEQSLYVLLDRQGAVVHTGYLDDLAFKAAVAKLVG